MRCGVFYLFIFNLEFDFFLKVSIVIKIQNFILEQESLLNVSLCFSFLKRLRLSFIKILQRDVFRQYSYGFVFTYINKKYFSF